MGDSQEKGSQERAIFLVLGAEDAIEAPAFAEHPGELSRGKNDTLCGFSVDIGCSETTAV